jgi:hypothetical protein
LLAYDRKAQRQLAHGIPLLLRHVKVRCKGNLHCAIHNPGTVTGTGPGTSTGTSTSVSIVCDDHVSEALLQSTLRVVWISCCRWVGAVLTVLPVESDSIAIEVPERKIYCPLIDLSYV